MARKINGRWHANQLTLPFPSDCQVSSMPRLPRFTIACLLSLSTLMSAPAHAEPAKCRYSLLSKLPLQYYGTGMSVTMPGKINDTSAVMLIDTGATNTFLTRFATDKRALRREPTMRYVTGVGGSTRLFVAPIKNMELGPIRAPDGGSLPVIDQTGERFTIDAIIGSDFLLDMDVELSLAEKQIRFFSPKDCDTAFLAYWNPAAVDVPMKFERDHRRPMLDVMLNGVKMRALIDTGAGLSGVTMAGAKRAGLAPGSPGVTEGHTIGGIGQHLVKVYRATFKTFSVGDETISNAVIQILGTESDTFDIVLGTDFLRAHRVLFAPSQMKIYLSYIEGTAPFNDGRSAAWIEQEAETGNTYAQFNVAMGLMKDQSEASRTRAVALLSKSVAGGNPIALHYMARQASHEGRHADSVALYERLVAIDAFDLTTQMELFVARAHAGQLDAAKTALAGQMARFRWAPWPASITKYYLGTMPLDEVLREAASEKEEATRRRCEVYWHAGDLQQALGQTEQAAQMKSRSAAECPAKLG